MRTWILLTALVVAACAGDSAATETSGTAAPAPPADATTVTSAPSDTDTSRSDDGCADVTGVSVSGSGPYTVAVTVSSPDEGWDKYADEWRILDASGSVVATRVLTHPHVDEQPFTRSQSGIDLEPAGAYVAEARDSVEGYCGETVRFSP